MPMSPNVEMMASICSASTRSSGRWSLISEYVRKPRSLPSLIRFLSRVRRVSASSLGSSAGMSHSSLRPRRPRLPLTLTSLTFASRSSSACLALLIGAFGALPSGLAATAFACAPLAGASLCARSACFARSSFLCGRAFGAWRFSARTTRAFFLAACAFLTLDLRFCAISVPRPENQLPPRKKEPRIIVDHSRAWKCPLESFVGEILLLPRDLLLAGGQSPSAQLVQLLLAPGQVELDQGLAELTFGFLGAEADVFRIFMGAQHDFQPWAALQAIQHQAEGRFLLEFPAGVADGEQRLGFGALREQRAIDVLDQRQVAERAVQQTPFRAVRRRVAHSCGRRPRVARPARQLEQAVDLAFGDARELRDLVRQLQAQRRRRHFLYVRLGDRDQPGAALGRIEVALGTQLGEQELAECLGFAELPLEAFLSVPAHVGIGVLALRQEQEPDRLVVRRERQADLERPPGRFAAGGIAIEAKHHGVREAQQLRDMDRRRRRAERRDCIRDI